MKHSPLLLLIFMISTTALPVLSEIVITPNSVRVDPDVPEPRLQIAIELPGGFIMRHRSCPWGEFKIHLPELADTAEHLSPSISGNRGTMSLYDWNRGKQALYCGEIYQMSDIRNKEEVEELPPTLHLLASAANYPKRSLRSAVTKAVTTSEVDTYRAIAPSSIVFADGDTLINDTEIITALIKSTQELRQLVDDQDETIRQLQEAINNERLKSNVTGRIASCTPNPADSYIEVVLSNLSANQTYTLTLVSLDGSIATSTALASTDIRASINVSSIQPGVYHLVLSCAGAVADTFRIIINH